MAAYIRISTHENTQTIPVKSLGRMVRENYLIKIADCGRLKHITSQAISVELCLPFVIIPVLS